MISILLCLNYVILVFIYSVSNDNYDDGYVTIKIKPYICINYKNSTSSKQNNSFTNKLILRINYQSILNYINYILYKYYTI